MKTRMTKFLVVLMAAAVFLSVGVCASAAEITDGPQATISAAAGEQEALNDGRDKAIKFYQANRTLNSYWAVWAAYAARNGRLSGYTYSMEYDNPDHNGAKIMAILAMGGDPYHYNGVNYVAKAKASGPDAPYAVPVFNFAGLKAAGAAMTAEEEQAYIDACCKNISNLDLGPDIGGWAIMVLAPYLDDPRYGTQIRGAIDGFLEKIKNGNYNPGMGASSSATLSYGCVVTALTGLQYAEGGGYDPSSDEPWVNFGLLDKVHTGLVKGEAYVNASVFDHQYYLEFCDLYNVLSGGTPVWLDLTVRSSDFTAATAQAEAILADAGRYTDIGVKHLKTAYEAAQKVSESDLAAAEPQWGETYFNLRYALENCKEKGDVSVFTDLNQGKWYDAAASRIVEQGIMNGVSPTTFDPEGKLTRAMVVRILWNMEGQPITDTANPFKDVEAGRWYYGAVLWAVENGITNGKSPTAFDPTANVTRQEMAAFLYRYTQYANIDLPKKTSAVFADASSISGWAKAPVDALVSAGIINGMNGRFVPADTATRAQMTKIIYELIRL